MNFQFVHPCAVYSKVFQKITESIGLFHLGCESKLKIIFNEGMSSTMSFIGVHSSVK